MKSIQLRVTRIIMVNFAIFFILFACSSWASNGPIPDADDLRITMECNWAITNPGDPEQINPEDYINDEDDDLVKLAMSLDYDPIKIYNWVYNNIYSPQYLYKKGSIDVSYYPYSRLGARGAFLAWHGNRWDQSSLLITLLRISGVPARYVKIFLTDVVYVEAYIEQENYYGSAMGVQKAWVPMVPWLKDINLDPGIDLFPTDGTITDPVPAELEFDFTDYLSSLKIKSALEEYEEKLQTHLNTYHPGKSLKDIPYTETAIDRSSSILPRSLPVDFISYYKEKFSEVPTGLRHHIELKIRRSSDDEILLQDKIYMPEIAGKKFALDWDYSNGSFFIPQFKTDGVEIDDPEIGPVALSEDDSFYIEYLIYGHGETFIRPPRDSGTYIHMGFDPFSASVKTIEKAKKELQTVNEASVLDPDTHEEFLGLMGQVLVETFLTRLHEDSKKAGKYFHGTNSWNLCPTFIYTDYNSIENPIPTDPESKFYYHPQWNIDAQAIGGFLKWDHANDTIVSFNWDAPIYQTCRWLSQYASSYNEGKIFEDWMDTPGASTIKGLMLANEDIHQTNNTMVELTQADIINETVERNCNFNTINVQNGSDFIDPYEAHKGFLFLNIRRVPDGWTEPQSELQLDPGAVSGDYAAMVWNESNSNEHNYTISRGTKFDLNTIKVSGLLDGVKYRFKAYRRTDTSSFNHIASKTVTANIEPATITFNWSDINKITVRRVDDTNMGPIILDNLRYIRKEYVPDLDNQTTLHLGVNTVMQIMNDLYTDGRVITPVQQVLYEGLEGNVRIVHGPGYDYYLFGMDNGGAAAENVTADLIIQDITLWDIASSVDSTTESFFRSENSIPLSAQTDVGYTNFIETAARKFIWVADPVDLVTGEFYAQEKPDIIIPSRGFDLSVVRTYRSRLVYNGPFGFGWTWNHGERVVPLEGGGFNYYNNDGVLFEISYENDAYVYPPGSRFIIETTTEGYLVTQNKSQLKSYFDHNGYLIKREDRFGNTLEYEYANPSYPNRITKIKDALDRSLTLTLDSNGKVTQVTDFDGRSCQYVYSGDDLVEFKGLDFETALGNSTRYEYMSGQDNALNNHNMTRYIMPGGDHLEIGYFKNDQVAYHTNAKGDTFNFHFSRLNRYSETWNEEGYYRKAFYNKNWDVTRITTELGTIEQMAYDDHHNKISHTDGNGNTTVFQYYPDGTAAEDQEGFEKLRKLYKKTNAFGHTWIYWYDDVNNPFAPSQIEDPEGRIAQYVYNPDGSLHREIQAPGYRFDTDKNLIQETGAPGFITEYTYDDSGNVLSTKDPYDNTVSTVFDTDRLFPVTRTDKNGNETILSHYGPGNSEGMPMGLLKSITIKDGDKEYTTTYEYNKRNQKTREINALDRVTEYQYTIDGKIEKTILPNSAVTEHIYDTARDVVSGAQVIQTIDPLSNSEYYTYNATGKMISKTDRNKNRTTYDYDAAGRLIKETDPLLNSITYQYDGNGNVVAKTDQNGFTSSYEYDAANRLIEEITPCDTLDSTCNIRKTYEYYTDGKIKKKTTFISETNHEDIVVYYEYDALGHMVRKTDGYGSSRPLITEYRHDALGRLVKTIQPLGDYQEIQYDANGNKVSVRFFSQDDTLLEETNTEYDEGV